MRSPREPTYFPWAQGQMKPSIPLRLTNRQGPWSPGRSPFWRTNAVSRSAEPVAIGTTRRPSRPACERAVRRLGVRRGPRSRRRARRLGDPPLIADDRLHVPDVEVLELKRASSPTPGSHSMLIAASRSSPERPRSSRSRYRGLEHVLAAAQPEGLADGRPPGLGDGLIVSDRKRLVVVGALARWGGMLARDGGHRGEHPLVVDATPGPLALDYPDPLLGELGWLGHRTRWCGCRLRHQIEATSGPLIVPLRVAPCALGSGLVARKCRLEALGACEAHPALNRIGVARRPADLSREVPAMLEPDPLPQPDRHAVAAGKNPPPRRAAD